MPNWARHAIAHTKHIITCSGAPWHAVIKPRRMARVGLVSPNVKRWADRHACDDAQISLQYARAFTTVLKRPAPLRGSNRTPPYGAGESC